MRQAQRIRGRLQSGGPAVDLLVRDAEIAGIEPMAPGEIADLGDERCLLAPPFFDVQVNGFAGVDFNRPSLTVDELRRAVLAMRRTGVAEFLPTVMTATRPAMEATLAAIARARDADPAIARAIPGIHVEGPFLAPEDGPRGAHPAAWILDPDWDVFRALQDAARGAIVLLTLAPERPGAIGLIWQLRQAGVVVGIAHTEATEREIDQAVEAGAAISNHLGNGAHAMLPRHRNYVQKQLATDALMASLICDGHHLPPYVVQNMVRAKGLERVVLITDAMSAAAAGPGTYRLGEVLAEVGADGYVRLPGTPYLAGSALTLDRAVDNAARFAGISLDAAIAMATRHPRRLLGRPDGGLSRGQRADLVVLRPGPPLSVEALLLGGEA